MKIQNWKTCLEEAESESELELEEELEDELEDELETEEADLLPFLETISSSLRTFSSASSRFTILCLSQRIVGIEELSDNSTV